MGHRALSKRSLSRVHRPVDLCDRIFRRIHPPVGHILGYPPIHQHHFHVVPAGVDVAHESGTLSHGDSACADEYGGQPGEGRMSDHIFLRPRYTCNPFSRSQRAPLNAKAFAEVNDVRVANSPPLEHYIATSLRLNSNKSAAERPHPIYLQPENLLESGTQRGNVPNMKERDAAFFQTGLCLRGSSTSNCGSLMQPL